MLNSIIFSIEKSYFQIEDLNYGKIPELLKLDTSIIQKIEFLGNDERSVDLENWKITPSHSDCYSAVEQAINSLAGAIIFKQEVLNKENLAKCSEDTKELIFNQFTSVDGEFFKSLNSNEIQSILKKCANIAIKVVYCGVSYSISAQDLLQGYVFDQMLFGSFKKDELTCISNQLYFTLPALECPFVAACLKALVEKNSDNFKMWSLLSLTLALLGADYFGHPEMEKRLIEEISYQKTPTMDDLLKAIEHLFLYNKRELIPRLIKKDGLALQYVNDELKNDSQVVSAACENNPYAIQYAGADIQGNREFMLSWVSQNGLLLRCASDALKNDFKIVSAACDNNPYAIQYAGAGIQGNREFMLSYISQNGLLLQYASDALKKDLEVVFIAYRNNPQAIQFADDSIQGNRTILLSFVSKMIPSPQYVGNGLKNDLDFAPVTYKSAPNAIQFNSDRLQDYEAIMPVMEQNKSLLQYTTDIFKDNPTFLSTLMQLIDKK